MLYKFIKYVLVYFRYIDLFNRIDQCLYYIYRLLF